jgi:unsaturated rhamnogalacturonyl hydrolase
MVIIKTITALFLVFASSSMAFTQQKANDVTTPLHLLKPDYKIPYGAPPLREVKQVLDRVYHYLDTVTPAAFVDRSSGKEISDYKNIDSNTIFKQGDYRLTSYEWGVTYSAMLEAGSATNDDKFTNYTKKRLAFLADAYPAFKSKFEKEKKGRNVMRSVIEPHALDDAGAMCAAIVRTISAGGQKNLRVLVDNFIEYIANKEYRLADKTLARNRPQKNTLWLDDLYMSVPALAQMGKLTGETKYYDDAVKQILQFSERMFNKSLGIYMHGWVEGMAVHPAFHWGRANGWALLAMADLLDVLPENHAGRKAVLEQFQAHAKGLASFQSGEGFWHQLLDRNDSYLETSATAIYAYGIARGVNKGWLDPLAYSPVAFLAWNAVATKVNDKGQVEGTCVGTGMAFDPAFYYYRPINVFAAHSYGPVILAGAEITRLLNNFTFEINDSSLQLKLR